MIEFLKERKIIVIIVVLVAVLVAWNIYNLKNNSDTLDESELLVSENSTKQEKTEDEENMIVVHITGEVKKPGVVKLKEGSRIEDIIEAAGGLTENADITNVNLAFVVEDGVKIRIPGIGDNGDKYEEKDTDKEDKSYITEDSGKGIILGEENKDISNKKPIVNINTATQAELVELPGIGPTIAVKIVEYRSKNGKFKTIQDIKKVTGIGENKFEKIKEYIRVR